jgi:hypothetical protein
MRDNRYGALGSMAAGANQTYRASKADVRNARKTHKRDNQGTGGRWADHGPYAPDRNDGLTQVYPGRS